MSSHRNVARRLCTPDEQALERNLKGTNMKYVPSQPNEENVIGYVKGYGHAVYATRYDNPFREKDTVVIFEDWRSYSVSTAKHLTYIEQAARRSDAVNLVYLTSSRPRHTPMKRSEITERIGENDLTTLGPLKARPGGDNE